MKLLIRVRLFNAFHSTITMNSGDKYPTKPYDSAMVEEYGFPFHYATTVHASAYLLHPFQKEVLRSPAYRRNVIYRLWKNEGSPDCDEMVMLLILKPPDKEIIDYLWNEHMLKFIWYHVEVENALFWLSTLGGAFSALGDHFDHCAEMAGKISHQQLQLSLKLGDEGLAARSRLYFALALAQKGKLKISRRIVRSVAQFAIQSSDRRLMRMCRGVWAKLRYLRSLKDASSGDQR